MTYACLAREAPGCSAVCNVAAEGSRRRSVPLAPSPRRASHDHLDFRVGRTPLRRPDTFPVPSRRGPTGPLRPVRRGGETTMPQPATVDDLLALVRKSNLIDPERLDVFL